MQSSSREEEVCPSNRKKERVMTMGIFLLSPVESCRGDHCISSREDEVCPLSPKKERSMIMVILLISSLESCRGGHGISSRAEEVCSSYSYEEEKDDHDYLSSFPQWRVVMVAMAYAIIS